MPETVSSAERDRREEAELPVHFLTIVLNGEPFIRYHLDVFRRLPFRWHWHVVEGVAALVHDTGWSVPAGGHVAEGAHDRGLSVDGTSRYLDVIAGTDPARVSVYRKADRSFWDGKREMVSAPLSNIREECLLWQVDADELWTAEQITTMRRLFLEQPERTAAYYWCHFFVAPDAVVSTRYNYAANPAVEWVRTWRYRPGDRWVAHEPPTLVRPRLLGRRHLAEERPFLHEDTEAAGAVFQHFAYGTREQVEFKAAYYGYAGAVDAWRALRRTMGESAGPLLLSEHLPWVDDETLVDSPLRRRIEPLAGRWKERSTQTEPTLGPIVVDGVFFQFGLNTGIARVWHSLLREWVASGFAERVVFLDRAGAGPRIPGLPTRSVPPWRPELSAEDALRLQDVCDGEGASLFVSSYYTVPTATPSAMLVYDLIPERLGLDMSDAIWSRKGEAIEHASSYACISGNTRRDLLELAAAAGGKPAEVVPLGVDPSFRPASEDEVESFRDRHRLHRPYFLVVGERRGLGGYKNTELLFRALRDLPDGRKHEIVCIGGRSHLEPELRRVAPRVRVRRLELADDELRLAYAGAVALVFPSRYEGFGLPVAEAMACGCPVVTTRLASIPEVADDAAVYVDPDDPGSLRNALDFVREREQRDALVRAGLERAATFTWSAAAAAFASVLTSSAALDTVEERHAREAAWAPRRASEARKQAGRIGHRRRRRLMLPDRVRKEHPAVRRAKLLVLRVAPLWLVAALRVVRASIVRLAALWSRPLGHVDPG